MSTTGARGEPGPDAVALRGAERRRQGRARVVMLGGSSPFAIGLLDAIAADPRLPVLGDLVLVGRNAEALSMVATYGVGLLGPTGWRVTATVDRDEALTGADIVLNQIRLGGLEGRRRDEHLAADLGVPTDETIGPAGLAAAIRIAPGHRRLADDLKERCPDALVLNMTNPLSCSTALLSREGVRRVVGLCELPLVTARETCRILEEPLARVEWTYTGLNHRGFIHRLAVDGRDLLTELPQRMGARTIGGITAAEIASLGAIPMKHFALFRHPPPPAAASRTDLLMRLRGEILEELRADPSRSPPSLRHREQPWYPLALVPMLAAIAGTEPRELVVNLPGPDGIACEVQAAVSAERIVPSAGGPTPPAVSRWLDRYTNQEHRIVSAATDPSLETIRAALQADPLVATSDVDALARRMLEDVAKEIETTRRSPARSRQRPATATDVS